MVGPGVVQEEVLPRSLLLCQRHHRVAVVSRVYILGVRVVVFGGSTIARVVPLKHFGESAHADGV